MTGVAALCGNFDIERAPRWLPTIDHMVLEQMLGWPSAAADDENASNLGPITSVVVQLSLQYARSESEPSGIGPSRFR